MPKNWNRRFKHNRDKMKTGDIFEFAEVVPNLSLRDQREGPLHGGEADVREGEEDPGQRADVREGVRRGRRTAWLDEELSAVGKSALATT